jgi:hypothetical protein
MFGKVNIIAPPDNLFNQSPGYLLVRPTKVMMLEFQQLLSDSKEDVNVFVFDDTEHDLSWLLSVSQQVGFIIINIDNCDDAIRPFLSLLLMHPNSCYISNNDDTPWELINRNRVHDVTDIFEYMGSDDDEDENPDDEE